MRELLRLLADVFLGLVLLATFGAECALLVILALIAMILLT